MSSHGPSLTSVVEPFEQGLLHPEIILSRHPRVSRELVGGSQHPRSFRCSTRRLKTGIPYWRRTLNLESAWWLRKIIDPGRLGRGCHGASSAYLFLAQQFLSIWWQLGSSAIFRWERHGKADARRVLMTSCTKKRHPALTWSFTLLGEELKRYRWPFRLMARFDCWRNSLRMRVFSSREMSWRERLLSNSSE